jgi:hypothetical protein
VVPTMVPCSLHEGLPPTGIDRDLAAIIEAWAALPDAIKVGITAMVRAAATKG